MIDKLLNKKESAVASLVILRYSWRRHDLVASG